MSAEDEGAIFARSALASANTAGGASGPSADRKPNNKDGSGVACSRRCRERIVDPSSSEYLSWETRSFCEGGSLKSSGMVANASGWMNRGAMPVAILVMRSLSAMRSVMLFVSDWMLQKSVLMLELLGISEMIGRSVK